MIMCHGLAIANVLDVTKRRFPPPLTSTSPHLRCDVGLEEGEYRENCLLSCSIVYYYNGAQRYIRAVLTGRSTVSGFDLA